jgi:hypothetical protein
LATIGTGVASAATSTLTAPTVVETEQTTWTSSPDLKVLTLTNLQPGDEIVTYGMVADANASLSILDGNSGTWTSVQNVDVANYGRDYTWSQQTSNSGTLTVTCMRSGAASSYGCGAIAFRNSSGIGAHAAANANNAAPSVSLTTTKAHSAVVVINNDFNRLDGSSRAWRTTDGGAFTETTYARSAGNYAFYGGYHADTGTAGTKTFGMTAPTGQKYSIVALEVKGLGDTDRIKAVDTMKISGDHPVQTQAYINDIVSKISGSIHANTVTIETPMDDITDYQKWTTAIHNAGMHVWHRPSDGTSANSNCTDTSRTAACPWSEQPNFLPSDYQNKVFSFIQNCTGCFQSGDLFTPNSEADGDAYWKYCKQPSSVTVCDWDTRVSSDPTATWRDMSGSIDSDQNGLNDNSNCDNPPVTPACSWTTEPTSLSSWCQSFNNYLLDLKHTADHSLAMLGVDGVGLPGVDTRFYNLASFYGPADCLADSTVAAMGGILPIDVYFDQSSATAESSAIGTFLDGVHARRPSTTKFVFGEYGWSNSCSLVTSDTLKGQVLDAALTKIFTYASMPVNGVNYWVGPGGVGYGGCTNIMQWNSGTSVWDVLGSGVTVGGHYTSD